MDFSIENNDNPFITEPQIEQIPNNSNWKYAFASETGTSHISVNTPKQDYCYVEEQVINDINYLFSAVADGAGSAKYSDSSSKFICKLFVKKAKKWLFDNEIQTLTREIISSWFIYFQTVLRRAARRYKLDSIRDFATTLLFGCLSDKGNFFVQIGDGIIAKGKEGDFDCIFLPQNGEYINTTLFATEKDIENLFMYEINQEKIERLVMHTDGIEMISYNFALAKPHSRFFNPIFEKLEASTEAGLDDKMSEFISGFLKSERVNQKTDDDKTLVVISSEKNNNEVQDYQSEQSEQLEQSEQSSI